MSSYPDPGPSQPWKRRKTTNACLECHRRKQKCDRNQPCSNCIVRNVAAKCIFYHPRSLPDGSGTAENCVSTRDVQPAPTPDETARLSATSEPHEANLGYSLVKGSNAFVDLKQLVQNESGFHGVSTAPDRPILRPTSCTASSTLLAQLPSRMAISELVAFFFSDVNWQYFILEKYYFDCLLACWNESNVESLSYLETEEASRELYYFPALLLQVLGLAIQFLPSESPVWGFLSHTDRDLCQTYSDIGIELMTHLGRENVALTTVQIDFLRSSWLKNIGKGVEAWHSVGNAIRSAQELDLHRHRDIQQQGKPKLEMTLSRLWYEEHKRRLWMNLCVWDTLTAMILGRPRTINPDDCDIDEPMDCNIPQNPAISVPGTQEALGERDRPNTISQNLFLYRLSHVWHTVRALKVDRPCPKDYSVIQCLHNQVNSIVDQLPPTLRSENPDKSWDDSYPYLIQQREDVLTKGNLMLMALHRPHIAHHFESRYAALQAAIVTLQSQSRSFKQIRPHQYKLFGLSFYTINASLLLSVIAAKHLPPKNEELKAKLDRMIRKAMDRLSVMYSYSPIARSGLAILQQCYYVLKKRWEDESTTLDIAVDISSGLETARQELNIDATIDGLSERQPQLLHHQHQQHDRQKSELSVQESLSTEDFLSMPLTSGGPTSSQCARTFDSRAFEPAFRSTTDVNLSLSLDPATTNFDETYWMNLINQTPNISSLGWTEADGMAGMAPVVNPGYDAIWDQIRL